MAYTSNFLHADEIIAHLGSLRGPGLDPMLEAKYVGFVAVACATVFELAIKEILIAFASKKHSVMGNFVRKKCERMNGRIQIDAIMHDYIAPFGERYERRFDREISERTRTILTARRRDIRASYKNLLLWRHGFAHTGATGPNATWGEVVQAYEDGKEIIECVSTALAR